MADYSEFPFDLYTLDELEQMLMASFELGSDPEFAAACREEIRRRGPFPNYHVAVNSFGRLTVVDGQTVVMYPPPPLTKTRGQSAQD